MFRLYLGFLGLLCTPTSQAQWIQSNGPSGGSVRALAVSNNVIIAATGTGGLFRSTNNGDSWRRIISVPTTLRVNCFTTNNSTLFAGTDKGIYHSMDNGDTWVELSRDLATAEVMSIHINGTTYFAGTWNGNLYRSTDNGVHWADVNTGFMRSPVSTIIQKGTFIFVGSYGGIHRSSDNGTTWTQADSGLPDKFVSSLVAQGSALYVGMSSSGVFRSLDNGATWQNASTGLNVLNIIFLGVSDSIVYAGVYGKECIYRSTDSGNTWKNIVYLEPERQNVHAIAIKGSNIWIAAEGEGIYQSKNKGLSWGPSNIGLTNLTVQCLVKSDSIVFAGTVGNKGMYWSTDGGINWQAFFSGFKKINDVKSIAVISSTILG